MDLSRHRRGPPHHERRFRRLLLVSLLLHLPVTPLGVLVGLAGLFRAPEPVTAPEEELTEIPISLLPDDDLFGRTQPDIADVPDEVVERAVEAAEQAAEALAAQKVDDARPDAGRPDAGRKDEVPDAGADARSDAGDASAAAEDAAVDAIERDGGARDAAADGEAGVEADAGPKVAAGDAGTAPPALGDPVALSGSAGQVADSNANVRVLIYTDQIRKHPIGRDVGVILRSMPQWRDFFGPAGIDPIEHIDRMLLAGPEFRDSRNVVAVLRYNVSEARMRRAISAIVDKDRESGRWLDGKVPMAQATADRASRLFVMPSPKHVVVAPPSVKNSKALGPKLAIPAAPSSEVAVAYVVTPARVFRWLPVRLDVPKSLRWVRLRVWVSEDGGAEVSLRALDENEELAKSHARELEQQIRLVTQISLPLLGSVSFVREVRFSSDGAFVDGKLGMSRAQLSDALSLVAAFLEERGARLDLPRSPGAPGSSSGLGLHPRPSSSGGQRPAESGPGDRKKPAERHR